MALSLLLAGAAVLAGGAGVAAHVAAKEDFDEAERLNERAKTKFGNARESLKQRQATAQKRLVELGRQKVQLHRHGLKPFVDAIAPIKEFEYNGLPPKDRQEFADELLALQRTVAEMEKGVGEPTEALVDSVALAGLAAYGSVGLLAPPSTGPAVLYGEIATKDTLPLPSGGTAASGTSAVLLGGVILVDGLLELSRAGDALAAARSNVKKAKTAAKALKTAKVAVQAVGRTADEVSNVLKALQAKLDALLPKLQRLVRRNHGFSTYSAEQRDLVRLTSNVAVVAHQVAERPLFDEGGVVTKEIRRQLKRADDVLRTIHAT